MDFTKFPLVENFCNKHFSDKKFIMHSELDLFINLRLTGLYNFLNILSDEYKSIFLENQNKNNRYITEIESEKSQIFLERKKIIEENMQKKIFLLKIFLK